MDRARDELAGGQHTKSTGSLVLSVTTFARAGLRFGLRGNATLTFTCDYEPFPVAVEIDTMVRNQPYIQLTHSRRSDPPDDGPTWYALQRRRSPSEA